MNVYYVCGIDASGNIADLAKFFTADHAKAHAEAYKRSYREVGVVIRDEREEDQHPEHRGLFGDGTPTPTPYSPAARMASDFVSRVARPSSPPVALQTPSPPPQGPTVPPSPPVPPGPTVQQPPLGSPLPPTPMPRSTFPPPLPKK